MRHQCPKGDGAHCDASALPVSGAHTGNTALSQSGDASSGWGGGLLELPRAVKKILFQVYRTFG